MAEQVSALNVIDPKSFLEWQSVPSNSTAADVSLCLYVKVTFTQVILMHCLTINTLSLFIQCINACLLWTHCARVTSLHSESNVKTFELQ